MKAAVIHEYGKPSVLKWEQFPDPKPGPGEVLVRVGAVSLNPIDWKQRSGEAQALFPVEFPGILGRDVAGMVRELGEGVEDFHVGDRVLALAWRTYAELCVVKASELAKIPYDLDIVTASTVPLVSLTGDQLMRHAAEAKKGQTILLTGALGSVGRCALFCALEIGAKVIAGVRRKQMDEAKSLGAVEAIDIDDENALARLGMVDAVASTLGGEIATKLLGKVKQGGVFGSVLGPPKGAELHPTVKVNAMSAHPDPPTVVHYAEAVRDGRLKLPISHVMPMSEAAQAHAEAEKGGTGGKIVLTA